MQYCIMQYCDPCQPFREWQLDHHVDSICKLNCWGAFYQPWTPNFRAILNAESQLHLLVDSFEFSLNIGQSTCSTCSACRLMLSRIALLSQFAAETLIFSASWLRKRVLGRAVSFIRCHVLDKPWMTMVPLHCLLCTAAAGVVKCC